ncbi:MAG TPA: alkaline phosphatase family protein [Thermoanaerobaculia bacterium]|jgi:predicted AlkP superfamily pyrophosphatase or phosphodiesterase|nr:alkaline phosphatase family protein [Thermoanaerobaculia bacterium]
MLRKVRPLAIVCLLVVSSVAGAAPVRPKLVVLISIDQFRADYLMRFDDLFLPPVAAKGGTVGGFRYLMEKGAYNTDAHHDHFPLVTGVGHSVHLTGAPPYKSGIIANDWFDRGLKTPDERYCVSDMSSPLVGAADPDGKLGVSPATLRVSTVGDELKMATGGQAKIWAVATKDRAAVLMAGHLADGVLWLDDQTGAWISSRYYRKDGTLPTWVSDWNAAKKVDAFFGKNWELSVSPAALKRLWTPDNASVGPRPGLGTTFPHPVTGGLEQPGPAFYGAFLSTPFSNGYTLDTAEEIVRQEKLGQDAIPDLLAINLSANDYIGHGFGPDSAEVLDVAVQTDLRLSRFFNFLAKSVQGGLANVTIVVTADHGVAPIITELQKAGFNAGATQVTKDGLQKAIAAELGPGDWVQAVVDDNVYLNLQTIAAKKVSYTRTEDVAAGYLREQPGIYAVYTRSQLLDGQMLPNDISQRVARSFHPHVSGELVMVSDPYWVPGRTTGATHGTPYAYDTSVPLLLAGAGIKPGRYTQRVSTLDIAPTLSDLLGILQPSGCEGHVLSQALK